MSMDASITYDPYVHSYFPRHDEKNEIFNRAACSYVEKEGALMEIDTTAPSYWLNWRFLLCAIWILILMLSSALIIWRNERPRKLQKRKRVSEKETATSNVYKIDAWGTCSTSIHPILLLIFRVFALCCMLPLIIADAVVSNGEVFKFYTEWTFTLVTAYFLLGSVVSVRGCLRYSRERADEERGSYTAPTPGDNIPDESHETNNRNSSVMEYALQIMFQMCAGAVVLTDIVFWLVLYPFLMPKTFKLNFIATCMHSVNAVFLAGELALNNLKFPFFRIAYFFLWTCIYVMFQWIVHACVSTSWPYSFLDLSSDYAPAWYLAVGLLHFPCFGIFTLLFTVKQRFQSQ